ncbi:hypothetical protein E3N88_23124 [Mikania micrantha]|uniref:Uncharacterized protein n=1 Tax=Mikania micrantha TaxID=192012 RepID=A0A5N6NDV1_9ASTR|nr:hypothetical protein E3N88_23124 [Mikania micrantha]
MNDDHNWVKSAMNDTELVANVLLQLRQAFPSEHLNPPPKTWTIRQRRSRPPPPAAGKKSPVPRASPTTPLSWSGATSVSGGGDEESSRPVHHGSDVSRSKVIQTNEKTPTKRPRRKKTLAELKEDEMTLLKERKQLKRQLATLQATCQKQRMENECLKKMKNDMKSRVLGVYDGTEELKNESFVVPDLNIAAGEDF